MLRKFRKSKYYLLVKFPFIALVCVLAAKIVFPHVEFVATRMIENKIGVVTDSKHHQFYSSIMTFMGAMGAMLYLLYMITFDELKCTTHSQYLLSITRRQIISSFLMILFAMFCFTGVHITPPGNVTLIETTAYSGLVLMMISFWYIFLAVINLFYINWNATSTLKEQFKEVKSSGKSKFRFF